MKCRLGAQEGHKGDGSFCAPILGGSKIEQKGPDPNCSKITDKQRGTKRTVPFVPLCATVCALFRRILLCFGLGFGEIVFSVFDQEVVPAGDLFDVAGIYAVAVKIGNDSGKELDELGV